MRRLATGLLLGALIFGVSFAGAKLATVTNPMTSDLDAAGYALLNVGNIEGPATSGRVLIRNGADFDGADILRVGSQSTFGGLNNNPGESMPIVTGGGSIDLGAGSILLNGTAFGRADSVDPATATCADLVSALIDAGLMEAP